MSGEYCGLQDCTCPDPEPSYIEQRIAFLVRNHCYDSEDETCICISHDHRPDEFERMTIVEHSQHVANVIIKEIGEQYILMPVELVRPSKRPPEGNPF